MAVGCALGCLDKLLWESCKICFPFFLSHAINKKLGTIKGTDEQKVSLKVTTDKTQAAWLLPRGSH